MKQLIKLELKRAFQSKKFFISLLIGMGIVLSHLVFSIILPGILPYSVYCEEGLYPSSVFNSWIGLDASSSFQSTIYFMAFPILAAYPYGDSLFVDLKSGYVKNVLTRCSRRKFWLAKLIALFLSGGIVCTLPLVFSFLSTMLFLPCLPPDPIAGTFNLSSNGLWMELFLEHPFCYLALFLIIDFVFGGLLAALCMVFTYLVSNRYIVMLCPFVLCMVLMASFSRTAIPPFRIVNPNQWIPLNLGVILVEISVALLLLALTYWMRGRKSDVC